MYTNFYAEWYTQNYVIEIQILACSSTGCRRKCKFTGISADENKKFT